MKEKMIFSQAYTANETKEINKENSLLKESIKQSDHYIHDDITQQHNHEKNPIEEEKQLHDHIELMKNEEVEKGKRELELPWGKVGAENDITTSNQQSLCSWEGKRSVGREDEEEERAKREEKRRRSIPRNKDAIIYEDYTSVKNYQYLVS